MVDDAEDVAVATRSPVDGLVAAAGAEAVGARDQAQADEHRTIRTVNR
jgi:hypothetical protein